MSQKAINDRSISLPTTHRELSTIYNKAVDKLTTTTNNNMKRIKEAEAMFMLGALPPTSWFTTKKGEVFQVGEAMSCNDRGSTFGTYERVNNSWYFRGYENELTTN